MPPAASASASAAGQKRKTPTITEEEEAAETRKREIIARVQGLDADEARAYLDDLCERWHMNYPTRTYDNIMATAFENFDLSLSAEMPLGDTGNYGFKDLDATIHQHEMEAVALYHHMRHVGLLTATDDTSDAPELLNRVLKVMEMVYYAKRMVLSAFQAKLSVHQVHCADLSLEGDIDARLGSWSLRFRWIDSEMNELQQLLLYLLDCAFERQLRKQDGYVFEPIVIDKRHNTHAFRRIADIKDWVYSVTQKELQWAQWSNLTHGNNTIKAVVDYLTGCNDYQFPHLIKRRDVFAFTNGIYIARDNAFFEYETAAERPLADSIVAAKFFDMEFEPYEEVLDWRLVPTPHFQSILDHQDLPPEVCDWMYVLIGRMLYDLNVYDGWQVIPFLKGHAGTGKSSICTRVVKNIYDPVDVGVMSNNIERKFGIGAFHDKYIFIGPECKNDLAIEQAEFQSIVSGEDVQINLKHKKAFSTQWKPAGMLAGNEVPSWADNAGSIQRRIVLFDFVKPVVHGDMRLGEKLESELPDLLVKCNRAYRAMAEEHGSTQIWTILPNYFKNTSSELAQTINALEAFMASSELTFGADCRMPFDDFKNAVNAFAQINGFPRPRFTLDFFRGPFTRRGIRRQKGTFTWRGAVLTREFLFGVDLVAEDTSHALL